MFQIALRCCTNSSIHSHTHFTVNDFYGRSYTSDIQLERLSRVALRNLVEPPVRKMLCKSAVQLAR